MDLVPVQDRAPGLLVGPGVTVPDDATIGGHVVIHTRTTLGAGLTIQDHAVIGKPSKIRPQSSAAGGPATRCEIGDHVSILAGAILFAGSTIGNGAIIGDYARVRERATIGPDSLVGAASSVDNDVVVGARVSIQTACYITARSVIEDDVFVGPGATTTNDNTMSRHAADMQLEGVTLRRACRIGGGSVICPGVEVGEEAFVGAGAVVTRDVPPRAVMIGTPARQIREVPEGDLLENWR